MGNPTTCRNCNSVITCGCQQRVATDGKQVCNNCITSYEQKLYQNRLNHTSQNSQQSQ
jgi:hypothetical protein